MSNYKKEISPFVKRALWRFLLTKKNLCNLSRTKRHAPPKILFIIGCQRSGTTLMTEIFQRDYNTKVYGEFSELSSGDVDRIRLNPLASVKAVIYKNKLPFVVLKPLVETQNALELLSFFTDSKALWLYRNFKDVAASNIKQFGNSNGINDLRPILRGEPYNWRSEYVSNDTKQIVLKYFSEDMNCYDAAALFWVVRNRLFFELNLGTNPNVMMIKYEELVSNPRSVMEQTYAFMGLEFPGERIVCGTHTKSINKGRNIKLSPEIEILCEDLAKSLDLVWEKGKL